MRGWGRRAGMGLRTWFEGSLGRLVAATELGDDRPKRCGEGAKLKPSGMVLAAGALVLAGCGYASRAYADSGEVSIPMNFGTNVFQYNITKQSSSAIAMNPGQKESGNGFMVSEFPGIGCFVTDQIRLGMNLQFTEKVFPEPATNLTHFGLLPQVNVHVWGPWTASLVPSFYPVFDGVSDFHFAMQGVLTAGFPLEQGFTATVSLEVPWFFRISASTDETVGITTIIGVSYAL